LHYAQCNAPESYSSVGNCLHRLDASRNKHDTNKGMVKRRARVCSYLMSESSIGTPKDASQPKIGKLQLSIGTLLEKVATSRFMKHGRVARKDTGFMKFLQR
jgi:hypothetical protein